MVSNSLRNESLQSLSIYSSKTEVHRGFVSSWACVRIIPIWWVYGMCTWVQILMNVFLFSSCGGGFVRRRGLHHNQVRRNNSQSPKERNSPFTNMKLHHMNKESCCNIIFWYSFSHHQFLLWFSHFFGRVICLLMSSVYAAELTLCACQNADMLIGRLGYLGGASALPLKLKKKKKTTMNHIVFQIDTFI